MRKIYLITIILMLIIVIASTLYIFFINPIPDEMISKVQQAEYSLDKQGIKKIGLTSPKYDLIELEYYYEFSHCNDAIKSALENFPGKIVVNNADRSRNVDKILEELNLDIGQERGNKIIDQNQNKNDLLNPVLPLIILTGQAELFTSENNYIETRENFRTIIHGPSACSEKILISSICDYLKVQVPICNEFRLSKTNEIDPKTIPSDYLCYEPCILEYQENLDLISHLWRGVPCSRIEGYNVEESRIMRGQCLGKDSCKIQEDNFGCCLDSQCVNEGVCYDEFSVIDVGNDGQFEVCSDMNGTPYWVNNDRDEELCNVNYRWIDCSVTDCKYGEDNYDKKENGLCCGDDKNEQVTECLGNICGRAGNSEFACCREGDCAFGGTCFKSGCNKIKLEQGKEINVYCDNGNWIDLDDNYCGECLREKSWSGSICCGDDIDEGKYPRIFTAFNDGTNVTIPYESCTFNKKSCVFPGSDTEYTEGCYQFSEKDHLVGGYYCQESQWYDLDLDLDMCDDCGFFPLDKCCGDDKDEFYISGDDETAACCTASSDMVVDGECFPTISCGNSRLEEEEQCEKPNSDNNVFCQQSISICDGKKFGSRDNYGPCKSDCTCSKDDYNYSCVKGECDAGCGSDLDCGLDMVCDHDTCGCVEKSYCGDGEVQEKNDDDWNEQCELPDTLFNPNCNETIKCSDTHTKIRYEYGSCDNNCQCEYTPFQQICVKGSCGGQCNQDGSGCSSNEVCDLTTCSCLKSDIICGNNICETGELYTCQRDCVDLQCPYRIDIQIDNQGYFENDTLNMKVFIYNKNNELMPNVDFAIDLIINNKYVDTVSHRTSELGYFETTKTVKSFYQSGRYEYLAYLAKTGMEHCNPIGDTVNAFVYNVKPPPTSINLSRFELAFRDINISYGRCGNDEIEPGETCEGDSICRTSAGCNYEKRNYDFAEVCNYCKCPADYASNPDNDIYCSNCEEHCGDGQLNCDEDCEQGMQEYGKFCRFGNLYDRKDECIDCNWKDDGPENDILISDCFCNCPESPNSCVNGDWIEIKGDYNSGCSDGVCNECNCQDTYTKDSNDDGIEDKCSPEICNNRIDDNDNGLIDMLDPECSICENCGIGNINLCDRKECSDFVESCYFFEDIFDYGSCFDCTSVFCEDYSIDETSCLEDTCGIGNCIWEGNFCCTDSDSDNVCDDIDNCQNIPNPAQEDSDGDGVGNACETCINEPMLYEPTELIEGTCDDGIDNDCNGMTDCQDVSCLGRGDCCRTVEECAQDNCSIETCIDNKCEYKPRFLCDDEECAEGSYCNFDRVCQDADSTEDVCILCVQDLTKNDLGIAFNIDLFDKPDNYNTAACCGNQENEYYLIDQLFNQKACCSSPKDCVDFAGNCVNDKSLDPGGHFFCLKNNWYECSDNNHNLCSEAGKDYSENSTYFTSQETGKYCTFDGKIWSWKAQFPVEICSDGIDNDCNRLTDYEDPKCKIKNQTVQSKIINIKQ